MPAAPERRGSGRRTAWAAWAGLVLAASSLPCAAAGSFLEVFSSQGQEEQQRIGIGRATRARFLQAPLGPPWTPAKVNQWLAQPPTAAPVGPHPYVMWVDQSVISTTQAPLPEHCCGCTCVFAWPEKTLPGGAFAPEYRCGGSGRIPEIRWASGASCFESYALLISDLDYPYGAGSEGNHIKNLFWAANIPPDWTELSAAKLNTSSGSSVIVSVNDNGEKGMTPACPSQGKHRYAISLYALGATIDSLGPGSPYHDVISAFESNRLARVQFFAEVTGSR